MYSNPGCKVVTAILGALQALDRPKRPVWAVLWAVKAVPAALKAVRKVVTAILEAMKARLRPTGAANQDYQWTRGMGESGRSWLLRALKAVPKALQAVCRDLMAVHHVLEAWL